MATRTAQDPQKFIRHASDIAAYFGFRPLQEINPPLFRERVGRNAISFASGALLGAECSRTDTLLSFFATPVVSHQPAGISARDAAEFSLQVSGCSASTAEIVIIKTLCAILSDWGVPVLRVRVNALGDRESRERFGRELGAFFRRRLATPLEGITEDERSAIQDDPNRAYASQSPLIIEMLQEAPRPLYFLSERSRAHFRGLLDQLEQIELPYELDDLLWGDEREPCVLFRLDLDKADAFVLASAGGRYDEMIARLAGRHDVAAVNASIFFRKKGATASSFKAEGVLEPKMYFIQLGLRAKLRGFSVVDALREANIPVAQSFDTTKLSPQLQAATDARVPYVLIMGEREAIDGTVIVRSVRSSSQTIVQLPLLPKYLRHLRV